MMGFAVLPGERRACGHFAGQLALELVVRIGLVVLWIGHRAGRHFAAPAKKLRIYTSERESPMFA